MSLEEIIFIKIAQLKKLGKSHRELELWNAMLKFLSTDEKVKLLEALNREIELIRTARQK